MRACKISVNVNANYSIGLVDDRTLSWLSLRLFSFLCSLALELLGFLQAFTGIRLTTPTSSGLFCLPFSRGLSFTYPPLKPGPR